MMVVVYFKWRALLSLSSNIDHHGSVGDIDTYMYVHAILILASSDKVVAGVGHRDGVQRSYQRRGREGEGTVEWLEVGNTQKYKMIIFVWWDLFWKKDTFSCCQYFYNWLWKKKTFWNLLLLVVKTFQCFANSYFSSERLESGSEQMFSSSFVSSSGEHNSYVSLSGEHNSYVSSSGEHKFFVSSSGAGTNYLSHRQVPAQFFCLLIMWHKSETQNNFIWNKCWQVFLSNND